MKRIFFILCMTLSVVSVVAQPAKRRAEQQKQQTQTGANALTTRALISSNTHLTSLPIHHHTLTVFAQVFL